MSEAIKKLPESFETEKIVLGALLRDINFFSKNADKLDEKLFFDKKCKSIYTCDE